MEGVTLTSELRHALKQAIDAAVRERRQQLIDRGAIHVCAGCGCDHDLRTAGCQSCNNRFRGRLRWTDPAYRTYCVERRRRLREAAAA